MPTRPNLVFLMPDQLRHDFLGCYGAGFVRTPHIDRLAAEGLRYDRAYSTSPVCVPARAQLLTGMNPLRTGVLDNGVWLRPDLSASGIHTWPELLARAGYFTVGIGKMHFYPWDLRHGFQHRVIAEDKRWLYIRDDYYHFLRAHGERKYHGIEHDGYLENRGAIVNRLPWELSVDHFVGQETVRFIDTYGGEEPFALMVGFPGPHCPYDPTPQFLDQVDPAQMPPAAPYVEADTGVTRRRSIEGHKRWWNQVDYTVFTADHKRKIRQHYTASVNQIDVEIGAIRDALERRGLLDNTVIIFASDHGDYLGDHDLIGKGQYYEASCHVPMIVRLPGGQTHGVQDTLVELTDVTATLLGLGGGEPLHPLDSRPLPGLGLPGEDPRDIVFGFIGGGQMAFDGRWKLAKYNTGEQHLFDLLNDPQEQHNRIADPAAAGELRRLDDELTRQLMRSLQESHHPERVYRVDLAQDPIFGKEGWQRPWPRPYGTEYD